MGPLWEPGEALSASLWKPLGGLRPSILNISKMDVPRRLLGASLEALEPTWGVLRGLLRPWETCGEIAGRPLNLKGCEIAIDGNTIPSPWQALQRERINAFQGRQFPQGFKTSSWDFLGRALGSLWWDSRATKPEVP